MSETTIMPEDMAELLTPKGREDVRAMFERYCYGPLLKPLKFVFCYYLDALESSEAEAAKLQEQVSALLELNDAGMELMIACAEEEAAIAAHDDSHAGRTPDTRQRLARAQANLQFLYDKVSNTREKCEALGLAVTPNQQVAHDA